ncbi:MAG: signal peptidase I [Clostridia bacterium]|nr:signal peptidase I [Clostridia bacterium]
MNAETQNPAEQKKGLFKRTKKEKPKKTVKQEIISWIITLAAAAALALLIRTFLFEPIRVQGESMRDTLQDKEIVAVVKPGYLLGNLNRGDVIICRYPGRDSTLFVKRLIALPGDSIEIINGVVYVNDEEVDESGIDKHSPGTLRYANYARRVLGEDEYFVMGDNRDNSNDSRAVGPIPRSYIIGHVVRVIFPLSKFMQKVE